MDWEALLREQPAPIPARPVWMETIAAVRARVKIGQHKHGTSLYTYNGRDALADAIQEQLDGLQYLVQALMEREDAQESYEDRLAGCAAAVVEALERHPQDEWACVERILRQYFPRP